LDQSRQSSCPFTRKPPHIIWEISKINWSHEDIAIKLAKEWIEEFVHIVIISRERALNGGERCPVQYILTSHHESKHYGKRSACLSVSALASKHVQMEIKNVKTSCNFLQSSP
jgi:hypothetical protein